MAQSILLDTSSLLEVKVEDDFYHIIYGFHRFASFHRNDEAAKRVIVVQLANMGVEKTKIAQAFSVQRASIYVWKQRYEEQGMAGVVSMTKGPESKFTESIKDYIYALYKSLKNDRTHKKTIADEVKKLYAVDISREGIRRVVNEKRATDESTGVAKSKEAPSVQSVEKEHLGGGAVAVKHGGTLLSLALLGRYGIEKLLVQGIEQREGRFGFKECVFSLLLLLGPRLIQVEENLKHYDDEMTGGLIGVRRLPSVKTVRRVLSQGCAQIGDHIEQMKTDYAHRCLELWGYEGSFYLDGHFMPYTGGKRTLYGYNPQRRLAEKGRTAYVVNTATGRPFYEVLSDGFDDFRANIEKIVDFLIQELGVKRPTAIFDRGGFGWESFESIEEKADFICWYNGKAAIPKGKWKAVLVPHESNIYGKPEYERHEYKELVTEPGDENGHGYRRMVFIKNGSKVSPAITNIRHLKGKEIALELTRRWGAQENVFKELVIDGYDKIHSYRKQDYEDEYFANEGIDRDRMMENPERRKLVAEKRSLENKRNVMLGRMARKKQQTGKTVNATKQQQQRLDEIEKRLIEVGSRLAYLPEKVLRIDYIIDNGVSRLSNEKKKYFDLLNLISYNVRRDMADIIGPVYENNRDVNQLVLKILRLMTRTEYNSDYTNIVFTQTLKGKETEVLVELCRQASSIEHETEFFPRKLSFRVE